MLPCVCKMQNLSEGKKWECSGTNFGLLFSLSYCLRRRNQPERVLQSVHWSVCIINYKPNRFFLNEWMNQSIDELRQKYSFNVNGPHKKKKIPQLWNQRQHQELTCKHSHKHSPDIYLHNQVTEFEFSNIKTYIYILSSFISPRSSPCSRISRKTD